MSVAIFFASALFYVSILRKYFVLPYQKMFLKHYIKHFSLISTIVYGDLAVTTAYQFIIMRNNKNYFLLICGFSQHICNYLHITAIQSACRLIKNEYRSVRKDAAGNREPLLLTARQRSRMNIFISIQT